MKTKQLSICLYLCAIIAFCGACKSKSSENEVQITPQIAFTANVNDKTVAFTNQSKDAIKYEWDFGDKNAIVTTASPTHTYANYGSYLVTLTGYSKSNTPATTKQTVTVLAPVCIANFSHTLGDDGVTFTNKSENAVRYLWDFGDKTTSTDKNPVHKYDVARSEVKIFTVTLTAYPQSGKESVAVLPITVVGKYSPADPSIAAIDWTPITPNVNDVVTFNAKNAQNVTSYKWDFGDGQTSTQPNPTHKYTKAGTYTVKLTYGNFSTSKNISSTITVNEVKKTYQYATVTSYLITDLKWTDKDGDNWDVGNGPDVFIPYVYKGSSTSSVYGEDKKARTEDVTASMLPVEHQVNWKLDASAKYTFKLYDYDPIGSNELMASFVFDIPKESEFYYPDYVWLTNNGCEIMLCLTWSN